MSYLTEQTRVRNYKTLGSYLARKREDAHLSQSYVAEKVGMKYSAQVSQIERGFVTVPPKYWKGLCDVLTIDQPEFYQQAMKVGYSDLYKALFGRSTATEVQDRLRLIL